VSSKFDSILLNTSDSDYSTRIQRLQTEHSMAEYLKSHTDFAETVRKIVGDIAQRGDVAVAKYTKKFDNVKLDASEFRVAAEDLEAAHESLDQALLKSLRKSIENVRKYQAEIFIGGKNAHPGIRYTPLKRVACCIPGASAPLPSTVIMTAVPAQVGGVKEIVILSPPRYEGSIHPVILGLCYELGITEVYRLGGAQAVAALAWGTETIAKVDKIVGPGHDVVQLAKKECFGLVDMDSFAGPSDVLIVANDQANPAWVAADMLSQAEHDPGAGIVVTDSANFAQKVLAELGTQCAQLDRGEATEKCLLAYSGIVICENMDAVIEWANDFAAEHLQVQCGDDSKAISEKLINAGAIFIGPYTPVAVGDYCAGPSHTLPTRQTSKYFSAVTSNDFVKSTSIIEYSQQQLADAAETIVRLALTEGLDAHAKSVQKRLK